MKKRILVVEDDPLLADVLKDNLVLEGFVAETVGDGNLALSKAKEFSPDLILLDVMLPGVDGFRLCEMLRRKCQTPIVMLTARNQKVDKLRGLDMGADDYVTKPFDLDELLARVRAAVRRVRPLTDHLRLGDVSIDFVSHVARRGSVDIRLTDKEFAILRYLAERQGQVVERDELLRQIWGYPAQPFTRSVDAAIMRLRRKLEADMHHPRFIHTAHGDGYRLSV